MTVYDEIMEKSKLIQSHDNNQLVLQLAEHITKKLALLKDKTQIGQGLIKYLAFDLSYILFRHQAWHHAPLFSELTIDHLNSEFRLPRSIATDLVESSLDIFIPYLPEEKDWQPETYDREFLFDLFVASATAKNESKLRSDIGFGNSVIQLFLSAAHLSEDTATGIYSFAPEIMQTILDIMQDIASEAQSIPWIMDIYRLRLITSQQRLAHKKRITRQQIHLLFQVLCWIGWQGIRHSQLDKLCQNHSNQAEDSPQPADQRPTSNIHVEQTLHLLNLNQLIYRHQIRGEDYYHLSALGLDLTADCLAQQLLTKNTYDLKNLPGLPAPIQAKIIKHSFTPDGNNMENLLKVAHRLAPEAIEVIVTKFAGTAYTQQVLELLQKLLHNNQNAWARVKILNALTRQKEFSKDEVMLILQQLTAGDPSPMVRKAARDMHSRFAGQNAPREIS
ncbi:MAG: hypothetical protein ACOH5I_01265 [Oligoflexus sp.]